MVLTEMRSYFALQGNMLHQGGWLTVITWSRCRIKFNPLPIQIFTARGGDKNALIVAEITPCGEKTVQGGRTISVKALISGKEI